MDKRTKKMDKLMEVIYEYPNKKMSIRDMAKKTGLSKSTIQNKMKILGKEGILNKKGMFSNTLYAKFCKIFFNLNKIHRSGLIESLIKQANPSCIILFGSFAKGESVHESDIDLFIETAKKGDINLRKYEKKLNHKIQIFIETDVKKMPDELFNNVVNGIKLYGYFDAR